MRCTITRTRSFWLVKQGNEVLDAFDTESQAKGFAKRIDNKVKGRDRVRCRSYGQLALFDLTLELDER